MITELIVTYIIMFGLIDVCTSDYFQLMSADGDRTVTRSNPFKLSVNYCLTNTRKNFLANVSYMCLQCFDAVGWAAGRASGL